MKNSKIQEIKELNIPEKILFLEELWDSIVAQDLKVPVPDGHKAELDRRLKRHLGSPGEMLTLDELKACIEGRK
jgi:putative addiction module component (TIGR02574 family)